MESIFRIAPWHLFLNTFRIAVYACMALVFSAHLHITSKFLLTGLERLTDKNSGSYSNIQPHGTPFTNMD